MFLLCFSEENLVNKLYFGDNLKAWSEHIADESVDLIYLDQPFNSNATYNVLYKAPEKATHKSKQATSAPASANSKSSPSKTSSTGKAQKCPSSTLASSSAPGARSRTAERRGKRSSKNGEA
jgi:16S rRNA G966 N2-methylase RsmD